MKYSLPGLAKLLITGLVKFWWVFAHFAESSNFTLAGSGPSPCVIINGRTQLGKRMHSYYFVLRFVTAR